jgi:hypothetical protein
MAPDGGLCVDVRSAGAALLFRAFGRPIPNRVGVGSPNKWSGVENCIAKDGAAFGKLPVEKP